MWIFPRFHRYFSRFDALFSLAGWVLWPIGLTWAGLMAFAVAYTSWFWDAYGWAGVAAVGFAAWVLFAASLPLFAIGVRWLRPPIAPEIPPRPASVPEWVHGVPDQLRVLKDRLDRLGQVLTTSDTGMDEGLARVSADFADLSGRLTKIEASLRPKPEGILSLGSGKNFETRLDAIEAMVQGVQGSIKSAVDGLMHTLDQRKIIQDQINEVILTSLRARDVLVALRDADSKAKSLGEKLISAETYENGAAWSKDHNEWGHNLSIINDLMAIWWGDKHQDLIEAKHYHYESENRTAPAHILEGEAENYRRYKHVCISHDRYLNVRRDVFAYFTNKAHNLPR